MDSFLKVLLIDAGTGFYRMERFKIGEFFGPVDLGLFLAAKHQSLNIGVGLLAGSIFPGSNRLVVSGFSPCWGSFYVSSMGGAGLVFDNLGVNMLAVIGRAPGPSVLYINRLHGEEVDLSLAPIDLDQVWKDGRGGVYSVMDWTLSKLGNRYRNEPRILAVGPAARATDFGAIVSAPVNNQGKISYVDTWAGRGGFGSKMLREHNLAAVIYGGTHLDEDFRDRKVADQWFVEKYQKKLMAKDMEATTKYRFDPKADTGGTFGVNYATIGGRVLAFNYRSMYWDEQTRLDLHQHFIVDHYLKQFNDETIKTKSFHTCGEPCTAVCKKMHGEFKKDYEPYQTMGPLCGIFDQRAAEKLNHHADMYGFDAISAGGVLAWLLEAVHEKLLTPQELGLTAEPVFTPEGFQLEADSLHNADLAVSLLDGIIKGEGILNLSEGARKVARRLARERSKKILDMFIYNANARKGWMVPNQYWTPGVLSPMAITGKYYMMYGQEFYPPRELGRRNAKRFMAELILDNLGLCRFHRNWAEEMAPEIIESLYSQKKEYLAGIAMTAGRINSRNSAIFWESSRNIDFIYTYLKRRHEIDKDQAPDLVFWLDKFTRDQGEAALDFWYEILKGVSESLREF
ncbi:MAG: aldehyde ferredoxin oxidoreductase [Deltaproteobacteria bacterium]|nr:aldehyde ferredoxin oxidoreductase [Deltaproteobacteria bacterium]